MSKTKTDKMITGWTRQYITRLSERLDGRMDQLVSPETTQRISFARERARMLAYLEEVRHALENPVSLESAYVLSGLDIRIDETSVPAILLRSYKRREPTALNWIGEAIQSELERQVSK